MLWILAQLDRDEALAKVWWNLSMIVFVVLLTVLFFTAMFMLRRWKQRQIKAIEQDRAKRRAGKTAERVDAWQASSERYVDHDKLQPDDDLFKRSVGDDAPIQNEADEDESMRDAEEEDRDPFGLFADKPFQEAEDDDEQDDDLDEDWDEDEDDEEEDKR